MARVLRVSLRWKKRLGLRRRCFCSAFVEVFLADGLVEGEEGGLGVEEVEDVLPGEGVVGGETFVDGAEEGEVLGGVERPAVVAGVF